MATQTVLQAPGFDNIPYRDRWARYVTSLKLREDWLTVVKETESGDTVADIVPRPSSDPAFSDLPGVPASFDRGLVGAPPRSPSQVKVGIVGAGAAGLFTGMIFDFLNSKVKGLGVDYEILEANKEDRVGGRLYTHHFVPEKEQKHQYYDVGAMRFPMIPIMDRTFALFKHLNMEDKLIEYYLGDEKNNCPTYFNDIQRFGTSDSNVDPDPYKMNDGLPKGDQIEDRLMRLGPGEVMSVALADFKKDLKKDIDDAAKEEDPMKVKTPGWDKLMAADFKSTRQFLSLPTNLTPAEYKGLGYGYNSVTWLETFEYGTGWYDQALAETVLESMDFDYPRDDASQATEPEPEPEPWQWRCLEGGAQQLAVNMASTLKNGKYKPEYEKTVTKIAVTGKDKTMSVHVQGEAKPREYFALFNSTTLGALQRMDLTEAGLTYGTKQAIRCLGYGASCKVAIRFSHAWWMKAPFGINKGGVSRTDLPLRVCVYPSYNIHDDYDKPAVLLCSYTWAQDAQRLGALISPESPQNEEILKELLLRNLALLHTSQDPEKRKAGFPSYADLLSEITSAYKDHHAFDWYADPYMSGAFAYFGPGQFSKLWPEITRNNGWFWTIGEAASAHHAWVVGALESSVRAVWQFLVALYKASGNEVYHEAYKMLEEGEHAPFGPLPLEMDRNIAKNETLLGFVENLKELKVVAHAAQSVGGTY